MQFSPDGGDRPPVDARRSHLARARHAESNSYWFAAPYGLSRTAPASAGDRYNDS